MHSNLTCLILLLVLVLSAARAHGQLSSDSLQEEVSFSNDIRPVVDNFCTTCHAGDNPEGEMVLTSYQDVRKHIEQGDLLERIDDAKDPMPPSGRLPLGTRRLFHAWAQGGFLNQGSPERASKPRQHRAFVPPVITPVDATELGFDLLEKMQGHWVGSMNLMGQELEWFAFDHRAIAPSHVHGIFEGGTIGNLFTSFFVADFKGKKTVMARNGGVLNGIYRTSYYVLDQAERRGGSSHYRLVDAYGGADIMWMELTFSGDRLLFKSYTSRFGLREPTLHMAFEAQRRHPELAAAAAKAVGFPKNAVAVDFSGGLPKPHWGEGVPLTSASYLWEEKGKSYEELGRLAGDPYRLEDVPHVAKLTVSIDRDPAARGGKLLVYLSQGPLTDREGKLLMQWGYLQEDAGDRILMFPELSASQDEFTFTYLHPGDYYLTVVADVNKDGLPSQGDLSLASKKIPVAPESSSRVEVAGKMVRN